MRQLNPEKHSAAILVILTLFAVVGPVSIDIFSPSLPAITDYFGTTNATAQWSIGIFMLGFSLSMLIVGPLSDRFGRKKTLLAGYSLYLVATAVAISTSNIYLFITARFAQALFGCFGTAIARTIARDYYSDKMEVRMLSYIGACLTIAPMAAPVAGGFIQEYAGWQANFLVMAVMATIAAFALMFIPERSEASSKAFSILSGYKDVLSDRRYMRFTIAAGTAFAGAFVFVAGAPFVMIDQLNVAPKHYGFLFAIAIAGYLISASFGPRINDRLGRERSTKLALALLLLGTFVSLGSGWLTNGQSVAGYMAGIVIYELGLGLFMPLCQARATEHMKEHIGTASGLIFFIEMLLATLISSLVGLLPKMGTISLAAISLIAVGVSTACLTRAPKHEPAPQPV